MLRLPVLDVSSPESIADAITALSAPGARLIAGGTDLLPNLKHRLEHPAMLVSLHAIEELRAIRVDAGVLRLGAGATLAEVAANESVRGAFPSLATAAGSVAGPQIRASATLGGNVNLDTRCRYVNQTAFWRSAIGGCLKAEGDVCHVVPKGRNCVAALSSDCVPALISHDASIHLASDGGQRALALEDYFHADGIAHTKRAPGEITTAITLPLPTGARRSAYVKWRPRGSIDFPLVSVALRFDLEDDRRDAPITGVRVIVGVLAARPREVKGATAAVGRPLGEVADLVSEATYAECKPVENVPYEAAHRRQLIRVLTRRAIEALAAQP
jgi:4-hydroxybenzoyl-CoA reductase subunit beta